MKGLGEDSIEALCGLYNGIRVLGNRNHNCPNPETPKPLNHFSDTRRPEFRAEAIVSTVCCQVYIRVYLKQKKARKHKTHIETRKNL